MDWREQQEEVKDKRTGHDRKRQRDGQNEKGKKTKRSNRFAVFVGAGGVFRLVVWPRESWEIFVMDGEVLRLFTGRLGYHANWKNGGESREQNIDYSVILQHKNT